MNPPRIETIGPFDLTVATRVLADINVLGYTNISIYAADGGGATFWGAGTNAEVGVKWRNSLGHDPADFSTAVNLTGPNTGAGMDSAAAIDVSRVAIVSLVVDVAEAGTKGIFHICLTDNRGL
jgi:hypothetical protein